MFTNFILLTPYLISLIRSSSINDDQTHEINAARCYSKCLQIFIEYKSFSMSQSRPENVTRSPRESDKGTQQSSFVDEIAHQLSVTKEAMNSCLNDTKNRCSMQCIQSCSMVGECICQGNSVGCLMACFYRTVILKEPLMEECPIISSVEETTLKNPMSQCPKNCKSRSDCNANQMCCNTETCDMICLDIEKLKNNLPKYKPESTQPNTSVNIEFDWSVTFKPYLNKKFPLVFILQTRSCLCYIFNEKFATPWQTLIRTHKLRVELNTFEKGTIYQFRLAAVAHNGTNGFGPISHKLPAVISKPPLPLPPENVIDYIWQITDENRFRVKIKWKKSGDPFWRNYDFLITWMVDHGVAQPDGEPLSSLTQYSKTLSGTEESCTIDDLKPSMTYKIQIVVRAFWHGYGQIMSVPNAMYITTPAMGESTSMNSQAHNSNFRSKECSCPDKYPNTKEIKIRQPTVVTRNLQAVIETKKYSDYSVEIYPEVCINLGNENLSKSIQRSRKVFKQTKEITITNLRFSCRYSMDITDVSRTSQNITYHMCFCTPPCNIHNPYQSKYCHNEDISIPSPKEPRSVLLDVKTMTYKISWKPSYRIQPRNRFPGVTKYRISWAPRKFEPVKLEHYISSNGFHPILDFDQSDVRIVQSNVTLFLLHNLTKHQLYIVKIQSIALSPNGELIESFPATILLPTYGYSDEFYAKSCQRVYSIQLIFLALNILSHQFLAS